MFRALTDRHETRVFHLNAAQPQDPLIGRLEHVTLDIPPPYEALSYEWGHAVKSRSITLQDGSVLPITESLHDALRDLRHNEERWGPRTLWVDAICINQENIEELQDQVSIMGEIYRQARRVITYLGPERDNSALAIAFARELQHHVQTTNHGFHAGGQPVPAAHPTLPPVSDIRWAALKALVLRTWASRCWCAHEFILNRRLLLMCGRMEIPDWHLISSVVQHVVNRSLPVTLLPLGDDDPHSLRECLTSLYRLRHVVLRFPNHKFSLLELLLRSHPFQASDPRDKIYSVLGLADDRQKLALEVDYTCTPEQLYTTSASKIVEANPSVEILNSCLHSKSLSLPSWVPDWSHWQFGSHGVMLSTGYRACGSTANQVEVDGLKLRVAGSLVDEIEYIGEPIGPHFVSLNRGIPERQAWLRKEQSEISMQLRLRGYSDEEAVNTFWRTLIGNITMYEDPAERSYKALYDALLRYGSDESHVEDEALAREFCDAARRRSRYRRLAVTKMGYIGAVPVMADRGDSVCMFQGGPLLSVIRPKGEGYTFLGHAYVHGLMHGEVLRAEWYDEQIITLV